MTKSRRSSAIWSFRLRAVCSFPPSGPMRSVSTRSIAEWTSSASAGHANMPAAISDAICSSARTMRALSSSLMIFCVPSMRACAMLPRTSCVAMRLSSSSDEVNSRIFGSSDVANRPDQRGLLPTRLFSRTSCGTALPGVPRGQFLLRHVEHGLAARAPQRLATRLRAQRHAEDSDESLRRLLVDAADAVLAADLVEPLDERDAAELLAVDFAGDTIAELDDDLARLRGRLLRIDRPLVDVARRRAPGVLEHAGLDRAAP